MPLQKTLISFSNIEKSDSLKGLIVDNLNIKPGSEIAMKSCNCRILYGESANNFSITAESQRFEASVNGSTADIGTVDIPQGDYSAVDLRDTINQTLNESVQTNAKFYDFYKSNASNLELPTGVYFSSALTEYTSGNLFDDQANYTVTSGTFDAANKRVSADASGNIDVASHKGGLPRGSGILELRFKKDASNPALSTNEDISITSQNGTTTLPSDWEIGVTGGNWFAKVGGVDVTTNTVAYAPNSTGNGRLVRVLWNGPNFSVNVSGTIIANVNDRPSHEDLHDLHITATGCENGGAPTFILLNSNGTLFETTKTSWEMDMTNNITLARYLGIEGFSEKSGQGDPAVIRGHTSMKGNDIPTRVLMYLEGLGRVRNYDATLGINGGRSANVLEIIDNTDLIDDRVVIERQVPSEFSYPLRNKFEFGVNDLKVQFRSAEDGKPLTIDKNSSVTFILYQPE